MLRVCSYNVTRRRETDTEQKVFTICIGSCMFKDSFYLEILKLTKIGTGFRISEHILFLKNIDLKL